MLEITKFLRKKLLKVFNHFSKVKLVVQRLFVIAFGEFILHFPPLFALKFLQKWRRLIPVK